MRRLTVSLACVAVLASIAEPAAAQNADRRNGFWWGLGVGYGWVHVSCDICVADRDASFSGSVRAGGKIGRSVTIGGEANAWMRNEESVDEYLGSLSVIAQWYPSAEGALYLKGGFAYVGYRIDDADNVLTTSGFGPELGAGYEFGIGRRLTIEPYLSAIITLPTGNLTFNGDRQAEGVNVSLLQVGLGVTWH